MSDQSASYGSSYSSWKEAGRFITVDTLSGPHRVFIQTRAVPKSEKPPLKPWITFLHGFPTSSWDWKTLWPEMDSGLSLLAFDFLGFGASDKPEDYEYSTFERADLTEKVWRTLGIKETVLVAHDIGGTVALELLRRQRDGQLVTQIKKAVFLNGGLIAELHKPLFVQKLLLNSVFGPPLSRLMSEGVFFRQMNKILAQKISREEAKEMWSSVCAKQGYKNYHKLIQYIPERKSYRQRWESELEYPDVPLKFIWGSEDPVAGSNVLDEVRRRNSKVKVRALTDCGHYPQIEKPQEVARELRNFLWDKN